MGSRYMEKMTCSSPNKVFTNAAEHSAKKANKEKKRKASEEVKQKRQKSKYSRTGESSGLERHTVGMTAGSYLMKLMTIFHLNIWRN